MWTTISKSPQTCYSSKSEIEREEKGDEFHKSINNQISIINNNKKFDRYQL